MGLSDALSLDFLFAFLRGLSLNILAAVVTLTISIPLAYVLGRGMMSRYRVVSRPLRGFTGLLHALPVFVALFFLSGLLSDGSPLLGPLVDMRPLVLLVLGILPYMLAYGADQFVAMFMRLAEGDRRAALLIIPNFGRSMQMVVSTSCLGAAIGVPEAMSVVIYTAEQMPEEAKRLIFFVAVGILFVIAQRICVLPFRLLHTIVDRRAAVVPLEKA
jgi:ABC-type amino acid transport system permease subunit